MTDAALLALGGVIFFIAMSGGYIYVRPNPRVARDPDQPRVRPHSPAATTIATSKR